MSVALHCRIWLAAIPLAVVVPAQDELSIRVEVDLVSVLCSVRDEHGALVNHLKQDDFILLEEGKPQTIRHFAREKDLPLTVGLLVDTSNSQVRLVEGERRAVAQFFSQVIRPRDAAFLMSFDAQTKLLMDRSSSTQSIKEGLEKLRDNSPQLQRRGGWPQRARPTPVSRVLSCLPQPDRPRLPRRQASRDHVRPGLP